MDELELRLVWSQHVGAGAAELEALLARHREPHRHHHGVHHVRWVVDHVRHLADTAEVGDLGAVIAAACYHDAIYDPLRHDNEAASARLAVSVLTSAGWDDTRAHRVATMIEATAHHEPGADVDTDVLIAADLAVLAADPAAYESYRLGVREEYAHVPDDAWKVGRAAVLRTFVDRADIFPPSLALDDWERRARANIASELGDLT